MKRIHRFLAVSGFFLASAAGCLPVAFAQNCAPPHRMRVVDLDMRPEPVLQNRMVESWRVTLRSDRNGECQTTIEILDRDQVAGAGQAVRIRPGEAVYVIPATAGYRFQGKDHCLLVRANIGGYWSPIEAQRVFCAHSRQATVWSLKE